MLPCQAISPPPYISLQAQTVRSMPNQSTHEPISFFKTADKCIIDVGSLWKKIGKYKIHLFMDYFTSTYRFLCFFFKQTVQLLATHCLTTTVWPALSVAQQSLRFSGRLTVLQKVTEVVPTVGLWDDNHCANIRGREASTVWWCNQGLWISIFMQHGHLQYTVVQLSTAKEW